MSDCFSIPFITIPSKLVSPSKQLDTALPVSNKLTNS